RHGSELQWENIKHCIDVGCGIGDVTKQCFLPLLPRNFKQLLCTDASPKMLEAARSRLHDVENVDFLEMDIGASLKDDHVKGVFDRFVSSFCIMYVRDQRKVFENVFELLAPGGDCFIILFSTGAIFEAFFQLMDTPKWKDKLKRFREVFVFPYREDPDPKGTIEGLLKSTGFTDILVKTDDFEFTFPTADKYKGLKNSQQSFPEFPNNMTEKDKYELLQDQVELMKSFNLIDEFRDETKPISESFFKILIVSAKKPLIQKNK
uniref:Methyltransferase type 12 domain-containing protein n=1 Tax=Phlebotomus papatasi TaxID=29031 RepID=A0A1B0D0X4_PHLPP